MEVELTKDILDEIVKGELARLFMMEICEYFEKNDTLTKDHLFKLGAKASETFKKEKEKQKKKNGI